MKNNKNERGFTLIEVIAAVFIFSIGILAAYRVIPMVISATSLNASKIVASQLSQEGIEIVRNIKDANLLKKYKTGAGNWDDGLTGCALGCGTDYITRALNGAYGNQYLNIDSNGYYSYVAGTPTKYKRKITITAGAYLNVLVEVSWNEKGKGYKFSAVENLYNFTW